VFGMARKLRVEYKGATYHLTVRSNGGRELFDDDTDRRYLLDRMAEAVETYQVRIYLFCLMSNHVHLVVETPRANLGRFMQSVLTGYGVYYNRRHGTHGHVTQGRYGARLVEGNAYLLKLSRYVHLNPVKIARMKSRPVQERLAALEKYEWSSFPAYAGLAPRNGFVDYEPVLALLEGPKKGREGRYRQFVGTGAATDDEEFQAAMWRSAHCIGSDDFREEVEDRYRALVGGRVASEDISFRRVKGGVPAETILQAVGAVAGVDVKELTTRQRDSRWRAVAARMLCRYGGLTQRAVAPLLGVRTGVAVSCQLRNLARLLKSDKALEQRLLRIERQLDKEQRRSKR
jgi:putative transposase